MLRNSDNFEKYAESLRKYAKELEKTSNFGMCDTLSLKEHKMLVEGYKKSIDIQGKQYCELEIADLSDFMLWERSHGGKFC